MNNEYQYYQDESGQWYYSTGDGNWYPCAPPVHDENVETGSWYEDQNEEHPGIQQPVTTENRNSETADYVSERYRDEDRRRRLHSSKGRRAHKKEMDDEVEEIMKSFEDNSHKSSKSGDRSDKKKKKKR
ncbi:uncharacterized protein CTRU02_207054 [Colletotrichum truncatum]|uniref:Uncharacterized protein n=1 Tax=Colletotrichum truncatum TaxID=5467 RepID=A0ACC3YZC8_COLTU